MKNSTEFGAMNESLSIVKLEKKISWGWFSVEFGITMNILAGKIKS